MEEIEIPVLSVGKEKLGHISGWLLAQLQKELRIYRPCAEKLSQSRSYESDGNLRPVGAMRNITFIK